ncbi:hypothetical protein KEM55_004893 [Ascosphaera atra]|nr:hypothetical protein KEM55_004893 [Ascosphaera atra]
MGTKEKVYADEEEGDRGKMVRETMEKEGKIERKTSEITIEADARVRSTANASRRYGRTCT